MLLVVKWFQRVSVWGGTDGWQGPGRLGRPRVRGDDDPAARSWYTAALKDSAATTPGTYLPPRANKVTEPYYDAFGRGFLTRRAGKVGPVAHRAARTLVAGRAQRVRQML